jgi:hypothetical protein
MRSISDRGIYTPIASGIVSIDETKKPPDFSGGFRILQVWNS